MSTTPLTLPKIGLGTYNLRGTDGAAAVGTGLNNGYRLLDSAFNYENEGAVAQGVRDTGIAREEVIYTSKLPGRHHAYTQALHTIEESVLRTGLGYIDIYLIHWPNPKQELYVEAWKALLEARERGLIKHVGVSNFLPEHLERIEAETGVRAELNQIELHPYFPQAEQLAYHQEHGIITEAWSPIARADALLAESVITEIAQRHEVTPTQTVLAWHVQRGSLPLPKSADSTRQQENFYAQEIALSSEEVEAITALGRSDGRLKGQDPAIYEEF